jgi:hypothetical protein
MKSDPRQAISDIVHSVRDVFKKYDRTARKRAWDSLQRGEGKKNLAGLIDNPTKPIVGVYKWLSFKEWIAEKNEDIT